MTSPHEPLLRLLARLLAAVPLGYGLTALGVSALASGLAQAGMGRTDAVVLMSMLGFVLYLLWLLWVFAVRSLARIYGALLLGVGTTGLVLWLFTVPGA